MPSQSFKPYWRRIPITREPWQDLPIAPSIEVRLRLPSKITRRRKSDPNNWVVSVYGAHLDMTGIDQESLIRELSEIIDKWASNRSWLPFDLAEVYRSRADLRYETGRYDEAIVDSRMARSLRSDELLVCQCRSRATSCYLRLGNYSAVRLAAAEAVASNQQKNKGSFLGSYLNDLKLLSLALAGSPDRAAKLAAVAIRDPKARFYDYQTAIEYAILAGRYQDALTAYGSVQNKFRVQFAAIECSGPQKLDSRIS